MYLRERREFSRFNKCETVAFLFSNSKKTQAKYFFAYRLIYEFFCSHNNKHTRNKKFDFKIFCCVL